VSGFVTGSRITGFALNVDVDLSGFDAIVPCGLADVTMTSLAEQGADGPLASRAREAVASAFGRAFSNADTAVIAPGS
jgi:lipoate-protein ligase B